MTTRRACRGIPMPSPGTTGERGTHTSSNRNESIKIKMRNPWTLMNNVQDCCRKYINYDSLHLKDVIARE